MDLLGCTFLLLVVHLYGLSGGSAGELARDVLRSTASIPRVERGESSLALPTQSRSAIFGD